MSIIAPRKSDEETQASSKEVTSGHKPDTKWFRNMSLTEALVAITVAAVVAFGLIQLIDRWSGERTDGDIPGVNVETELNSLDAGADVLTVLAPTSGEVFISGSRISGESTTEEVEYHLSAGGTSLAAGTVDVVDGKFEISVPFTNDCCIEMILEVGHPSIGFTSIPLTYPESS